MSFVTRTISVSTKGFGQVVDLTDLIRTELLASGIDSGNVTIFIPGSTAGVTTIEFESGVIADFQASMDRLIPESGDYMHNARWGDGNGFSHVRAAWIGPSLTIPFMKSTLMLGTWQQVVLVDFDNRPRQRQVVLQYNGE